MNTKTQHTPTPWKVRQAYLNGEPCNYTIHTGMTTIAGCSYDEQGEANASRIVKCVNAHDELVAALRELLSSFDELRKEYPCDLFNEPDSSGFQNAERATALLAKLEGGAK